MGDPAGIGGEITPRAWRALRAAGPAFVALDDPARLSALDPDLPVRAVASTAEAARVFPRALPVLPVPLAVPAAPGRPDPRNAAARVVLGADDGAPLAELLPRR